MRRNVSGEACPEWLEKALCRCGCQQRALKRKFSPESQTETMSSGIKPSSSACVSCESHLGDDPACKLPKPRLADEYWLGDRQVSAEEFERSCVEDAEREKRDLDQHVRESAENLMAYLNGEGGLRTIHDISNTEVGALAACVLMLDKEREP